MLGRFARLATLTLSLGALAAPAAQAGTRVFVQIGAPAPVVVGPAAYGSAWQPGYYAHTRFGHRWVPGYWVRDHGRRGWGHDRWERERWEHHRRDRDGYYYRYRR